MYRRFEMSQICIERCRRYVSAAAKTFLRAAEKMQLMAHGCRLQLGACLLELVHPLSVLLVAGMRGPMCFPPF